MCELAMSRLNRQAPLPKGITGDNGDHRQGRQQQDEQPWTGTAKLPRVYMRSSRIDGVNLSSTRMPARVNSGASIR